MQSRGSKWWLIVVVLASLAASTWAGLLHVPAEDSTPVSLTQLTQLIETGRVKTLTIDATSVLVETSDGEQFTARKESNAGLITTLRVLGITPEELSQVNLMVKRPSRYGSGVHWLIVLSPLLLLGLWFSISARSADSVSRPFDIFSRSPAQHYQGDLSPQVTFDDVAGEDEAKQELEEVVAFLHSPMKFAQLGAHLPHGILLVGPPGCGKTLLARAVAGEAGVPFLNVSASEFVEMFAGVGAGRVRHLFNTARKLAPCIIFIDELDAVGRLRRAGMDKSSSEREQTLNQLLVEMDGFEQDEAVVVLAATNRPDILDPALLRPGRFDRRVVVDLPDLAGREAILTVYARDRPLAPDVDLGTIARQTAGFSGAELENVVNEAAILAVRHHRQTISMMELQEAVEKVRLGPERSSRILNPADREMMAYHEAGHALVCTLLPGCDPVSKVSITPRGPYLSYTLHLPETDRRLHSCARLKDKLAGLLAGRVAEELSFNNVSTHATDDLRQATRLARQMVTRFGMSSTLGPLTYDRDYDLILSGGELQRPQYSEATAQTIDAEVMYLVTQAYQKAQTVLRSRRTLLARIANQLLSEETIEGKQLASLIAEAG